MVPVCEEGHQHPEQGRSVRFVLPFFTVAVCAGYYPAGGRLCRKQTSATNGGRRRHSSLKLCAGIHLDDICFCFMDLSASLSTTRGTNGTKFIPVSKARQTLLMPMSITFLKSVAFVTPPRIQKRDQHQQNLVKASVGLCGSRNRRRGVQHTGRWARLPL